MKLKLSTVDLELTVEEARGVFKELEELFCSNHKQVIPSFTRGLMTDNPVLKLKSTYQPTMVDV